MRKHDDGNEHLLLVYNDKLYDVTLYATRNRVWHDPQKLKTVIQAGKPMIFFHNHPPEDGRAAMFPSYEDFGVAGLFSFMVYGENPDLAVEFRVIELVMGSRGRRFRTSRTLPWSIEAHLLAKRT